MKKVAAKNAPVNAKIGSHPESSSFSRIMSGRALGIGSSRLTSEVVGGETLCEQALAAVET